MKSLIIATVLALAGFASLTATASADHNHNNYRGSQAGCNTGYGGGYGGGFGQWSQGPVRRQLNLYPQSGWNGGHGHNHGHNHGHVQRRNNNGGLYFGNRDFSLGIRF
jgi:hypothetical protein